MDKKGISVTVPYLKCFTFSFHSAMKYLLILAFCLCGALATPIEDKTSPDELATELDFVEDIMDEVEDLDVADLEDEGNVTRLSTIVEILKILIQNFNQ